MRRRQLLLYIVFLIQNEIILRQPRQHIKLYFFSPQQPEENAHE